MSDVTEDEETEAPKPSKMPLILGLVAGLLGAGGGFFATYSGLILSPPPQQATVYSPPEIRPLEKYAYVALEPLIISLAPSASSSHLRFTAQLEVVPDYVADVEDVLPRIIDILNGYLRAVKVSDLEDPAQLIRMRSQMLRRVQIIAGPERVNDLLIMEFILT